MMYGELLMDRLLLPQSNMIHQVDGAIGVLDMLIAEVSRQGESDGHAD
jgi:hypothetical protein